MQTSLAVTALLMGCVGGPHCMAMCGSACAGIGHMAGARSTAALWAFQAGRVIGYAGLGGLAGATIQGVGWLTIQSAALRPVWTLFHVFALFLGLVLLLNAKQPNWMEVSGKQLWMQARKVANGLAPGLAMPLLLGFCWALLPCGLLYSALLVAAMTADVFEGAAVMALFALGTSVSLLAGPWLWLRLKSSGWVAGDGNWGVRLAGTVLAASSLWALWLGFFHNAAPWCVAV